LHCIGIGTGRIDARQQGDGAAARIKGAFAGRFHDPAPATAEDRQPNSGQSERDMVGRVVLARGTGATTDDPDGLGM